MAGALLASSPFLSAQSLSQQNDQILKNQVEMTKTLDSLKQDILQLRRRTS